MTNGVTESMTVKGDLTETYARWMDFENYPSFMENVKSVTKPVKKSAIGS